MTQRVSSRGKHTLRVQRSAVSARRHHPRHVRTCSSSSSPPPSSDPPASNDTSSSDLSSSSEPLVAEPETFPIPPVVGDAERSITASGHSKSALLSTFKFAGEDPPLDRLPTVPWWAATRLLATEELEPDLKEDPENWFKAREGPPPVGDPEYDPCDERLNFHTMSSGNDLRRPYMVHTEESAAVALSDLSLQERISHTSISVGTVYRQVTISSLNGNVGCSFDLGADYDAALLFDNGSWGHDEVKEKLSLGGKRDVRVTQVRDPSRFVWALEVELVEEGLEEEERIGHLLRPLKHAPIHVREEDVASFEAYAKVMEEAARPAGLIPLVADEEMEERQNLFMTHLMQEDGITKSWHGRAGGEAGEQAGKREEKTGVKGKEEEETLLPPSPFSFAEDFVEFDLTVTDPTLYSNSREDVELYRSRNAYFLHRYLSEQGMKLTAEAPEAMFDPEKELFERGGREGEEDPQQGGPVVTSPQYPHSHTFSFSKLRSVVAAEEEEEKKGKEKKVSKPYSPVNDGRDRLPGVAVGLTGLGLRELVHSKNVANTLTGRMERQLLSGMEEIPVRVETDMLEVARDCLAHKRFNRRRATGEEVGGKGEVHVRSAVSCSVDAETGEVRMLALQTGGELEEEVEEVEYEVKRRERFTQEEIDSFIDIGDIE